ncbi:MAG TPA: outer membrane beta-barrel protein [Gallionella sp.]|nr:outer membrane beta-barrel protein [Gallionella sp.]
MRKVSAQILLTAVLLGAAITNSIAATEESGNNAAATSTKNTLPPEPGAGDTLPPEPGTTSDTLPPEPGAVSETKPSTEDAATKRLQAEVEAKAAREKSLAGKSKVKEHASEFWGKYFGAKIGINNSSVTGTIDIPSASTLAYGAQGGYLQGGYNWELYSTIVGLGVYYDVNNFASHSDNVGYSSRSYGLDFKLGLPVDEWLPYVKLGYGRGMATSNADLNSVSQYGRNIAIGVEFNVAPRWSLIAELKSSKFSNDDNTVTVHNKLLAFGFNYYLDKPLQEAQAQVIELNLPVPEPILDPNAVPEAPPAP